MRAPFITLLSFSVGLATAAVSGPSPAPPAGSDILRVLGPLLSRGADIYLPAAPKWTNLTQRWNTYASPTVTATVEVGTRADVQQTVKYATKRGIKILVRNTSHGFTKSLEAKSGGIQISLSRLNSISVNTKMRKLTVGGGVENWQIVDTLQTVNQRTSTGGCDCVGIMGLALGGGHGKLQGLYGVVSDVLLEAEVVLASGEVVTASEKKNQELFWGLRGAGHNFGIVTKAVLQTFDNPTAAPDIWLNADFWYYRSQLTEVFTFLESYRAIQPAELTIFTSPFPNLVEPDTPPIIRVSVQYFGTRTFDDIATPFLGLTPFFTYNTTQPWNLIATNTGIGKDMGACLYTPTRRGHFSAQLPGFNLESVEKVYDFYAALPEAFKDTSVVWESYPLQKFQQIPSRSTAYPHRDLNVISLVMVNYEGADNDAQAKVLGEEGRKLLVLGTEQEGAGNKLRTYTNYAEGLEGAQVWYGGKKSERQWRLEKLNKLKKQWDPKNVWSGYNPIIPTR